MATTIGMWGRCMAMFPEEKKLIHPDDLSAFESLFPFDCLFKCVDIDEPYLVVERDGIRLRVKEKLFQNLPTPSKEYGEDVQVISQRSGEIVHGTVKQISWHFKNKQHIFKILVDGKFKSKQYSAIDFI